MRPCRWHGWLMLSLLAGCAHTPPRPHPAPPSTTPPSMTVVPSKPQDVNQIPDAVPRLEPRSPYGNPPFYVVSGHRYAVLPTSAGYVERGVASWYGTEFHGLRTSTGEPYDMFAMTAAHKTLPLPCYARVTNLSNGRSAVVRINDRGPFVDNRIIDLSYSAARKLDIVRNGTAFVQVEVLTPAAPSVTPALPVAAPAVAAASIGVSAVPAVMPSPANAAPAADASSTAASTPSPTQSATSLAPVAPASASAAAPLPVPTSTFYIQVGAYARRENADSTARKLRAGGIEHVITLAPSAYQPLQRVRVGPIESVQQFDALIARLLALGYPGARLAQD
jgi:rare lipoprotein A